MDFEVLAGQYDDGHEINVKYSDVFATLDDAIEAHDKVSDYPWAYIQYKGRTLDVWAKGNDPLNR
ncbi:hypothetical protein [Ferrimonas aestuarii]|uniref:Uncharacterized protein n=1 Tax=Ferrimonas aestuarii TaxID=2569539 RepID=A0A4U1BN78_9GAMM|nr:hypothetical protein [Ferrimonas aestuarii]TKB53319.1 hypothetical protein FCL42_14720 [Ferrimonas aestuarii]